jgi:hypothetical protein
MASSRALLQEYVPKIMAPSHELPFKSIQNIVMILYRIRCQVYPPEKEFCPYESYCYLAP